MKKVALVTGASSSSSPPCGVSVEFVGSKHKKENPEHNVFWVFLVRVVIQHFLKTIVVQFVFEVIG